MKTYHIVWNASKSEGFITDNEDDAEFASSGFQATAGVSSLAAAFRETYADEDEDEGATELACQTVELP